MTTKQAHSSHLRDVATAYGATLPEFGSLREAKKALFAQRDDALDHLEEVVTKAGLEITLDNPEALLALERFYFEVVASRGFRRLGTTKTRIEEAFGFFVGSLLVKNVATAKWIVERFAFGGSGYEIGVALSKLESICGVDGLFVDLDLSEPNKLKRLMHREYTRLANASTNETTTRKDKRSKSPKPNYGTVRESTRATRGTSSGTQRSTKTSTAKRSASTKKKRSARAHA